MSRVYFFTFVLFIVSRVHRTPDVLETVTSERSKVKVTLCISSSML